MNKLEWYASEELKKFKAEIEALKRKAEFLEREWMTTVDLGSNPSHRRRKQTEEILELKQDIRAKEELLRMGMTRIPDDYPRVKDEDPRSERVKKLDEEYLESDRWFKSREIMTFMDLKKNNF